MVGSSKPSWNEYSDACEPLGVVLFNIISYFFYPQMSEGIGLKSNDISHYMTTVCSLVFKRCIGANTQVFFCMFDQDI